MALCISIPCLSLTAGLALAFAPGARAQLFTPNLRADSITPSTTSWTAGATVTFSAKWTNTVIILGDAGAHRTGIYFSTNSTISTGDTLLTYLAGGPLKSGYQRTWNSAFKVPDSTTPNGTKYLGMFVDDLYQVKETDENDNIKSVAISYRSGRDLYITSYSLPSSAVSGSTVTVGANVYNVGHLSATGFYTGFFLSTNSTISHTDHYLGSFYTSSLSANTATGLKKINIRLPCVTSHGTHYFGIEVDCRYDVTEKVETNNIVSASRTISAPPSSTRRLEYVHRLQTSSAPTYMSTSQTLAVGYASRGGYVDMVVTAPAMAGGLQLCAWSHKNPWTYDVASEFSLSLINNPALFPGWFSTLNAQGQATPQFQLPKGAPLTGTLSVYTQSFLFNKVFKFGGTTDVVRTILYK